MIAEIADNRLNLQEMADFGQLLKKLRNDLGFSQEELASRAETSAMTVSKLERGLHDPSERTRRRLAKALEMPIEELDALWQKGASYIEVPTGVLEGLKQRAATENSTLDEWLARQATLSLSVFDESDRVATPALKTVKQQKASGRGRRSKRAGSQGK